MKSIPDLSLKNTMTRADFEELWIVSVTALVTAASFCMLLPELPVPTKMMISAFWMWVGFSSSITVVWILRSARKSRREREEKNRA
jgi:hypothetical protein